MSVIDKALAAISPAPSEDARAEASRKAREAADPGDWLSLALDHHDQIRRPSPQVATPGPPQSGQPQ